MFTNKLYTIRDLANSAKYQTLISTYEEICSIPLFKNNTDFSKIQIMFLSWLKFYKFLRQEVANDEVSELVLSDEIYADAYYYWRSKKYKKWLEKQSKNNFENKPSQLKIVQMRKRK